MEDMEEMIRDTDETSYQNSGRKEQREERDNFSGLMKTRESTDPGSTLCPTREDGEGQQQLQQGQQQLPRPSVPAQPSTQGTRS